MSAADVIQLLILLTAVAGLFFTIGAKNNRPHPSKGSSANFSTEGSVIG